MNIGKLLFILTSLIGGIALTFISVEQLGQITYRLEWEWGQAQPTEQGWTVTNDLGYEVQVNRGYLVAYSAELIGCEPSVLDTAWLFDYLGPQPAYAGHGADPNETRLTASYIEDLRRPVAVTVETVTVTPHSYCQAHYLIGPAGDSATQNLPQDVNMIGQSLFIAGAYIAPGAERAVSFTLQTRFPDGVIRDLSAVETNQPTQLKVTTNSKAITVAIRRDLGTMFNGVDFEQMSESEQARAILRSLTDATNVVITNGNTPSNKN